MWRCFSSAGPGNPVTVDEMNGGKYRSVLKENLLDDGKVLRLWKKFMFLKYDSKHTVIVGMR